MSARPDPGPRPAASLTEAARAASLHRLGVLDGPPAADFQALTRLAARLTGAPVSAVNFLSSGQQRTVAATGMTCGPVPQAESLCAHTVAAGEVLVVADAAKNPQLAGSPFVTGERDQVRLYAGVPLRDPDGQPVGTLCVTDPAARDLTPDQLDALQDLATLAEQLLEQRAQHAHLLDVLAEVDAHATRDPLTGLPNRRMLGEALTLALARAERSDCPLVVFFGDLDGFKTVNDTCGHDTGVELTRSRGHRAVGDQQARASCGSCCCSC